MPVVLPQSVPDLEPWLRALLEPLLREVRSVYGARLVSLAVFGSLARGTAAADSDVDVLIVAEDLPQGRLARGREFLPVEESLETRYPAFQRRRLSPIYKTPAEVQRGSPLFWGMTEEVILLYDRDGFLQKSLEAVKRRLRELNARRVFKGEAWYWILKWDCKPGEVFEL